jgi:hypothetical protein
LSRAFSGKSQAKVSQENPKAPERTGKKRGYCHKLTCDFGEIDRHCPMSGKLFLGHRLRRLRRDHQLSQTDMADQPGDQPQLS